VQPTMSTSGLIVEQNLVGISGVMLVVFCRCFEMQMTRHMAIVQKHDVIPKTGSTQRMATPSEEDRTTATGNVHKIGFVRPYTVFELCRQTDMILITKRCQIWDMAETFLRHGVHSDFCMCASRPLYIAQSLYRRGFDRFISAI